MKLEIKNRWSGQVQFSAEIDCDDSASMALKIGLAVKWAFRTGTYLGGAYLRGADLSGADLSGADLRDADLRDAYLRGADLRGAYLGGADLRDADLRDAYLRDAYLRGAYLGGADLRDAYLGGAYLRDAYLGGADLRGADLRGGHKLAAGNSLAMLGMPDDWHTYTYCTDQGEQRIHVGCRDFTLPEARKYWTNKPDRREVLAAVDYAEAIGRIRGWGAKKLEAA